MPAGVPVPAGRETTAAAAAGRFAARLWVRTAEDRVVPLVDRRARVVVWVMPVEDTPGRPAATDRGDALVSAVAALDPPGGAGPPLATRRVTRAWGLEAREVLEVDLAHPEDARAFAAAASELEGVAAVLGVGLDVVPAYFADVGLAPFAWVRGWAGSGLEGADRARRAREDRRREDDGRTRHAGEARGREGGEPADGAHEARGRGGGEPADGARVTRGREGGEPADGAHEARGREGGEPAGEAREARGREGGEPAGEAREARDGGGALPRAGAREAAHDRLPPLRVAAIALTESGEGSRARSPEDEARAPVMGVTVADARVEPGVAGEPRVRRFAATRLEDGTLGDARMLADLASHLVALDPDVLVTFGGEARVWGHLVARARRVGVALPLGRDGSALEVRRFGGVTVARAAGRSVVDLARVAARDLLDVKVQTLANVLDYLGLRPTGVGSLKAESGGTRPEPASTTRATAATHLEEAAEAQLEDAGAADLERDAAAQRGDASSADLEQDAAAQRGDASPADLERGAAAQQVGNEDAADLERDAAAQRGDASAAALEQDEAARPGDVGASGGQAGTAAGRRLGQPGAADRVAGGTGRQDEQALAEREGEARDVWRLAAAILPMQMDLARRICVPLDEVSRMGRGRQVEALLLLEARRTGRLPPNPADIEAETYEGGLVLAPTPGLHENVQALDFSSMYPSIMIRYNVSPETWIPQGGIGTEWDERGTRERMAAAHEPNAAAHQPNAAAHEPTTAEREPMATAGAPNAAEREPHSAAREPMAAAREHATAHEPNAAARAAAREHATPREPNAPEREPMTTARAPNAAEREPMTTARAPNAAGREPMAAAREADVHEAPGVRHRFRAAPRGFFPAILEGLIEERRTLKAARRARAGRPRGAEDEVARVRETTLKVLTNAFYGYTGWPQARWYSRACAEATAAWGRRLVGDVVASAKAAGVEVLYGDTDSLFVRAGGDAIRVAREAEALVATAREDEAFDLALDERYETILFTGAKKRYAGLTADGRLVVRGFEARRGDWCALARRVQARVLAAVLADRDARGAIERVRETIQAVEAGEVPLVDLVIHKTLVQRPSDYKVKQAHVEAVERAEAADPGLRVRAGSQVSYVILAIAERDQLERGRIEQGQLERGRIEQGQLEQGRIEQGQLEQA
ncbi:MAG TPA: DNA polymerase domain-containing protein, partial [Candidatus Thermoplasmatota archaeon]|nr:DNA polymerase domain-containing protein [Candidatus Thermoplasmatota archaeon]